MIRLAIIFLGLIMIFKKLFKIIKARIENYNDISNKHLFNVQLAKTDKEREIGLMWVKKMSPDAGMLFEYPDDSYPSMWMKNTLIPLDAIFINQQAKVVYIANNMQPNSLESKKSKKVCKYVLEINGGLSKKMNIKEGDLIGTTLLSKNITNFKNKSKENMSKNSKQNTNKKKTQTNKKAPTKSTLLKKSKAKKNN